MVCQEVCVCVCEFDDVEQTFVCGCVVCVCVYVEDGVCCGDNFERRCVIDCVVCKNGLPSCAVEPCGTRCGKLDSRKDVN